MKERRDPLPYPSATDRSQRQLEATRQGMEELYSQARLDTASRHDLREAGVERPRWRDRLRGLFRRRQSGA